VIDILTVVFQQELYYLKIQARSIELYIDSDKIGKIFVVVNDESSICDLVDKTWWGKNQNKVVVIDRKDLGIPHTLPGWESQQYHKLACAAQAESSWSMCLDAKTWFVQTVEFDKIFDSQGRVCFSPFPTIPVFKPAETFVENYFNIDSKQVIGPGGVPFFFKTEEMQLLCDYLKNQGTNLLDFFEQNALYPTHLTEFMFYSGWIKYRHGTLYTQYSEKQFYQITNIASFQLDEFELLFKRMQQSHNLTASIHRAIYPMLSSQDLNRWVDFLLERKLIDSRETAIRELNT